MLSTHFHRHVHAGVREVEEWMSRASGVPLDELRPYLFLLRDRDATGHLLRVAGGLDSLVMGEGQILAQVKQVRCRRRRCHPRASAACRKSGVWWRVHTAHCPWALASRTDCCRCLQPRRPRLIRNSPCKPLCSQVHKVGQNSPGFGRHLNGLFKQAVTAGKRVRAETSISSGAVSVSSAAAELALLKLPTHDFNDAKVRARSRT